MTFVVVGLALWLILTTDDDSAAADQGASLSAIIEDPRAFTGQQVTVSGVVADTDRPDGVFTIGEDGRVVVLAQRGADVPSRISEGDTVQVRGRVEFMSPELGDAEEFAFDEATVFSPSAFEVFEEDVALVASRVDSGAPDEGAE